MKKIGLIFLFTFSFFFSFAQETQFGIKGGLNVSDLTNNQSGNLNSRLGFHLGALAHVHLSHDWAIQPEVVFSSQGGKYIDNNNFTEHHLIVNYINIPLQLQYMFAEGFRLQTGPQIGFLTNAKDEVGGYNTGYVFTSDFKNVDFSWSFGLGYESYSGLGVDARYNVGISNVNNAGTATIHNDVFQLGIFYLFSPSHTHSHRTYTHRRH